jgi:dihydroorotase
MSTLLRNGHLVDPWHCREQQADLYLENGKIQVIGSNLQIHADHVLDLQGLTVIPGLIDSYAHLPNQHPQTIANILEMAVKSGVTSIVFAPDSEPILDEPGLVEVLLENAAKLQLARAYCFGALTKNLDGQRLNELVALTESGCLGFSMGDAAIQDDILIQAMRYAATFDYLLWLKPCARAMTLGGIAFDGKVAMRLGLPARPHAAETAMLAKLALLAEDTEARVHIGPLSLQKSAQFMARFGKAWNITLSTTLTHLLFCEDHCAFFDSHLLFDPPLASLEDQEALNHALMQGRIDLIYTDHRTLSKEAKERPFGEAKPGTAIYPYTLPLLLLWQRRQQLSLIEAVRPLTTVPAQILGIPGGMLAEGAPADLCIFDQEKLLSANEDIPLFHHLDEGRHNLKGQVMYTFVNGRCVYSADHLEKR